MIRKIKVLGLTLVAVFAMTAVAASAASATEFHSEASSTELTGAQQTENVFTVNNRTVKCKTANFVGSQSGLTSSTVELHPIYGECTAFGLESTVTTTGCDYVLHSDGEVDVVCEAGKEIEIDASGTCHANVGSQSGLGSVSYSNVGSGSTEEVLVTANVGSIKAEVTGSTLVCGTNGTERQGTYTGSILTEGSSGGGQVGIRWGGSAAEFHSESSSTELNGAQQTENVFSVNNRTMKCRTATFAGGQSGTTASTVEVHPTYGNCTAFGLESTWTTTGCNYVFHSNGEVDIVCEAGKEMEWFVGGTCQITIGSQSGLKSVSYSNVGSGSSEEIRVTANVGSIDATVTGSVLVCGTNGMRTITYNGSILMDGSSGGSQVGIRWE